MAPQWRPQYELFHAVTKRRRTCNRFTILEDNNGYARHEEPHIVKIITEYFQDIFTTKLDGDFHLVHEVIDPCISETKNRSLISIPNVEEIKAAMLAIHPSKAPGPDVFSVGFFHSYWSIIGGDIVAEVQRFFISGDFPLRMNETHVRLIPKSIGPRKVSDYRPIALCNVFYKIVAKIITKQLQPILPT